MQSTSLKSIMPSELKPTKQRIVSCPQCKGPSAFSPENAFRPFCSERCKLIDLGQWATESYTIAEPIKPGDLDMLDN